MSTTSPSHSHSNQRLHHNTATLALIITLISPTTLAQQIHHDPNACQLYIAESTIPNAGIGVFAGTDFRSGQLLNRNGWGDPAFPAIDLNRNNADPDGTRALKSRRDYHWPLTNYDWDSGSLDILEEESDDTSMTVTGFGAVPNCHFSLINVAEHGVSYDLAGLSRYDSPGSGAITPFVNRSSTARNDIRAGTELFVNYGSSWFKNREDYATVPVKESYVEATKFLEGYGRLLLGNTAIGSGWRDVFIVENMVLKEEAQSDLWDIIKTFPYVSRARQALPGTAEDAIKAIHKGIPAIEVENSMRSIDYLQEYGKCVDNIVPGNSTIPHAGRGAFATRFIPKGSLVAPAPLIHFADKSTLNIYNETRKNGNVYKDNDQLLTTQIIRNYMFGHQNSSVVLFPYSSNVAYINHHSTKFNAKLQWAKNFSFHNEDWLQKDVKFLDTQWRAGLMLEFIATRDINEGEEILIDYGEEWQKAWDEHVKNWAPVDPEKDFNNYTHFTKWSSSNDRGIAYRRAEEFTEKISEPIRTMAEQEASPYPRNVVIKCRINIEYEIGNYTHAPQTTPMYKRKWVKEDMGRRNKNMRKCNITGRRKVPRISFDDEEPKDDDGHPFLYTIELNNVTKQQGRLTIRENHVITSVPFEAIEFVNEKYSSDMFLKNAFRHEMALPDGLWPEAWMNLALKNED